MKGRRAEVRRLTRADRQRQTGEPLDQAQAGGGHERGARLATGSLIGVLLAISLTACGHRGDLTIINNGPSDVTVLAGDDVTSVSASGGTVAHDYGCTPGDVTVRFASGQEILLPGPVCPDQRIMVGDGTATLQPASSSDS